MKRVLLLGIVFFGIGFRALPSQEPTPEVSKRYRLFQVVATSTLQQKIEESAGEGYRLVQLVSAPGGTLAAIMEKAGSPSSPYQYIFRDLKYSQKISNEFSELLSQFAAEGFHLYTILNPALNSAPQRFTLHFPSVLLVMEKPPGTADRLQYEVLSPGLGGLGSFNQKKIASLLDQGYIMVQTAWLWKSLLIFEKRSQTQNTVSAAAAPHPAHPSQGYRFLTSNPYSIPEKEIQKAATRGFRVVAVIRLEYSDAAATEQTVSPSGPYEYLVIKKPQRSKSAVISSEKEDIQVFEDDLNRAGEKGFRLFQQNMLFEPFLMEKAPGSTKRFQYRFMVFPNLAEFSEKLEEASSLGYQVVAMSGLGGGMAAIMEKSEPGDIK
jgi:hypothetical protein